MHSLARSRINCTSYTAPFVITFLWLFGFFVLTYTGIETLKNVREPMDVRSSRGKPSYRKTFASGFLISLSNPLSILFWLGIYGSILAKTAEAYNMNQLLIYSSGIMIGILIWDFCMAITASTFRNLLHEKLLRGLTGIAGVSLCVWLLLWLSGHQTVIGLIHEGQLPAASSFNIVSR